MAGENIFDLVLARTLARVESVTDRISKNFKGVKPFDEEPVDPKDAELDFEEMMNREPQLRRDFGDDVIDAFKRNRR